MASLKLPPLPQLPKRSLTPPARKAISGTWTLDEETPVKNERLPSIQAVMSVCDAMNDRSLSVFAELGFIFGLLDEHQQKVLLAAARKLEEKRRG